MMYFLTVNQDWQHAEEFLTEAEAREAWRDVLADGYENAHSANVYSAPHRAVFDSHMGKSCQLICAGIPRDHPFLASPEVPA